jgi:methyl coenzyme M reductase alpha subunit
MKIKREQREFLKAMKKKFAEEPIPKQEDVQTHHPTIIVGGL